MNEVALRKQIEDIDQEVKLSGEFTMNRLIQLQAEVDQCKLELEAIRRFLDSAFPSFTNQYNDLVEKVNREFNPIML